MEIRKKETETTRTAKRTASDRSLAPDSSQCSQLLLLLLPLRSCVSSNNIFAAAAVLQAALHEIRVVVHLLFLPARRVVPSTMAVTCLQLCARADTQLDALLATDTQLSTIARIARTANIFSSATSLCNFTQVQVHAVPWRIPDSHAGVTHGTDRHIFETDFLLQKI